MIIMQKRGKRMTKSWLASMLLACLLANASNSGLTEAAVPSSAPTSCGIPGTILPTGHKTTPCACSDHPANYLGNFKTNQESACIQSCYNTTGCVSTSFNETNSNCHMYSAICICTSLNSATQYQIVMDTCPTESAAQGLAVPVTCSDIPELDFENYFSDIQGRSHVAFDSDGVIEFSARGGNGLNILLANSATLPEEITESYADMYELFIGGADEPIIYATSTGGSAPEEGDIVDISAAPCIVVDSYTSIWIKLTGTELKVGRGVYSQEETGLVYQNDFGGSEKGIDEVIFTYGYGDLECVPGTA